MHIHKYNTHACFIQGYVGFYVSSIPNSTHTYSNTRTYKQLKVTFFILAGAGEEGGGGGGGGGGWRREWRRGVEGGWRRGGEEGVEEGAGGGGWRRGEIVNETSSRL